MKKIVLTIMSMLAATMSYAQKVQVLDGDSANTFKVNVIFFKAVDLGLSSGTKWANMNVGATCPADYGAYFMWGYTMDCSDVDCSESECKTYAKIIDDWQGQVEYDAAAVNWGDSWVTPTTTQMDELVRECNWTWSTDKDSEGNEIKGYKVASKTNGNSIFIPAAGYRYNTNFANQGSHGLYWSSSPNEGNSGYGLHLYFTTDSKTNGDLSRSFAVPIRPVAVQ